MTAEDPQVQAQRAETVANMANAIKEVIAADLAYHGPNDPAASGIVAAALALVIIDFTQRVDPLMTATMIVNLGGTPFVNPAV